ncbi:MAG: hypothetical protein HN353_12330 [Bdellovibrionales bacterium]|jgi:hypothetical protein|nr:hypothetical protein [Bdellovibrionales bacterium]MBT3526302.1 hypothetical protein [Bdellovibrionales bacterium]MBT7668879.1 hypothetical protein [Bdellovibrionales bacterium]MBT7767846.1 hypothetical protein [Bdellovibrionales bacterium]
MISNLKKLFISSSILCTVVLVPLPEQTLFKTIRFKGIPASKVIHFKQGLTFKVDSSNSTYIYPFRDINEIGSILVEGSMTGVLNLRGKQQGTSNADDYIFKIGLIIAGEKRLNFAQRLIAPNWVIEMENILPNNIGVERVEFYIMVSDRSILNTKRVHPLSDLFIENRVWLYDKNKKYFSHKYQLNQKMRVIGLWISSDGDNTKSKFSMTLTKIRLN